MKTLLNYKSLIKVAVIMVVLALIASQMTNTYADDEDSEDNKPKKVKQVEITNWDENPCCEQNQINNVPQVIQREFNTTLTSSDTEIGTLTVPPSKMLIIELITVRAPVSTTAFPISVITTVDGSTVEHSIGGVGGLLTGAFGGNNFESFSLIIYAEPNTNVIFSSIPRSNPTPFRVTFSGRLIDVP